MGNICSRDPEDQNVNGTITNPETNQIKPAVPDPEAQQRREPVETNYDISPGLGAMAPAHYDVNDFEPIHKDEMIPTVFEVKKVMERKPWLLKDCSDLKLSHNTDYALRHKLSGNTYYGHVHRGLPQGWGMFVLKNGGCIQGNFVEGMPFSHIRKINPNGSFYEGQLTNYQETGEGKLTTREGTYQICGTWIAGVPHGFYEEFDSTGKLLFRGAKVNGQLTGHCFVTLNNATVEGTFQSGVAIGPVTKTYLNGSRYVGQVKSPELLEEGQGKLTFTDGRVFEGTFARGLPNGTGKFTNDQGKGPVDQTWKDGKRV